MEAHMWRLCRLVVAIGAAAVLASCGSTNGGPTGSDALTLELLGFSDLGITQCDQVNPEVVDMDLIQDMCSTGGMAATPEPFTETSMTVMMQDNQKLDITIRSYNITFHDTGAPAVRRNTSQTVRGKRCSNDTTRACAVDSDCIVDLSVGSCRPSVSDIQVLLADFETKAFLIPDIGNTVTATVRLEGTDVTGADWAAQGDISVSLEDFNNCGCDLGQ